MRGSGFIAVAIAGVAVMSAGCPGDFDVEGKTFPCRSAADCVEGYECHSTRYVCVVAGTADGGASIAADAGTGGSGIRIGDRCSAVGTCEEGICVDSYCCESSCTDDCHRCDQTPGRCLPVAEGSDPDAECAGRQYECSQYTAGLTGTSCFAGVEKTVTGGTCGPGGVCRPVGCAGENGVEISRCENSGCLRDGACPAGASIAWYDDPSELCVTGVAATCALSSGDNGCCSLLGACCPGAMCTPGADCE